MAKITFITAGNQAITIDAADGLSVMECARREGVPGIIAECGGACSCATCHVVVADDWSARIGTAEGAERDMLEFADDVGPTSRLSCQIKVTPDLDGLVVYLPGAH